VEHFQDVEESLTCHFQSTRTVFGHSIDHRKSCGRADECQDALEPEVCKVLSNVSITLADFQFLNPWIVEGYLLTGVSYCVAVSRGIPNYSEWNNYSADECEMYRKLPTSLL
jgi:hypothetical protein